MTPQREVILEEIQRGDSHPTADEVYAKVRKRLPRISLGTVYRNLEILSQAGLIGKVRAGGTQRRFHGKGKRHYHARCLRCGRLDDLPVEPQRFMEEMVEKLTDYHILGHELEFVGLCFSCKGKSARRAGKRSDSRVHNQKKE